MTEFEKRKQWFETYVARIEKGVMKSPQPGVRYPCPCCGYPTLEERGGYEICQLCNWEDDGQHDPHADEVWGGPNSNYSLAEARNNFQAYFTMYRPEDTRACRLSTNQNEGKNALISLYQQIMNASNQSQRDHLWKMANEFEKKL